MYLFTAPQIKAWDKMTMEEKGISSLQLMENAATALTDAIIPLLTSPDQPIYIFCGNGNNGGDGLAIARLLRNKFYNVAVFEIAVSPAASNDYTQMRAKLQELQNVPILPAAKEGILQLDQRGVIIDAILGTGTNRKPEGSLAELIQQINESGLYTIAVDLPSGMMIALTPAEDCIHADATLTIQSTKLPFVLEENRKWLGKLQTVDISLSRNFNESAPFNLIDEKMVRDFYQPRDSVSHKGNYGHCAILAGNTNTAGAAIMAAKAGLRSGAGYVTLISKNEILQSATVVVPEAMTLTSSNESIAANADRFQSIGIGCGLSVNPHEKRLLTTLLSQSKTPLIIDADGLNMLAQDQELINFLPLQTILTPHPGEFDRLFGKHQYNWQRIQTQKKKSAELGIYIVLKTSITSISTPSGVLYFNSTGNPGMAKAGSGDVLLGLMTGLLARHKDPLKATICAVYLHGLAGDLASKAMGEECMYAGDIIQYLPDAFMKSLPGN